MRVTEKVPNLAHKPPNRSNIPDIVQNFGFWASIYNGRSIIGPIYRDHLAGVSNEELIAKYKQATAEGDKEWRTIVWA